MRNLVAVTTERMKRWLRDGFLLCFALFLAATVLPPSGAAGKEACERSELRPAPSQAMRFPACGGAETHQWVMKTRWRRRRAGAPTQHTDQTRLSHSRKHAGVGGGGGGGGEDAADHVCAQHSETGDASNEAQRQKHTHAEETAGTGAGEEGTNSPGGEEDVRT